MALVTLRRTQIDSVYSWGMCILCDGIDFSHALAVVMVWELKRELGFFFFFLIICNALLDKNGTPLPVLLIQTNEQEEKNSATAMVLSSWVRMHQGKGWLGALIASKQTFENNSPFCFVLSKMSPVLSSQDWEWVGSVRVYRGCSGWVLGSVLWIFFFLKVYKKKFKKV